MIPENITANRKIKLLITDDHLIFRTGVRRSLQQFPDLEVIGEAENGADLLDKLQTLQPDVITLDLMMPVMNGVDTLAELKKRHPSLKIVILSMYDDPAVIAKCIELGAHSYLTCDAGSRAIYEAVTECYRNGFSINKKMKEALAALTENNLPDRAAL